MQHLSFSDFEAYTDALGDVDVRLMLLRQEQPRWQLYSLLAGQFHIQKGQTGSPVIAEAAAAAGGRLFWISVTGQATVNGQPEDGGMVLAVPGGADFTIAAHGAHEWVAVYLPTDLVPNGSRSNRCNQRCSSIERPGPEHVMRLRELLEGIIRATQIEPRVLMEPAALARIQNDLFAACKSVTGVPRPTTSIGRPLISRAHIIRIAKELVDRCDAEDIQIDDLAAAANVSLRTFQNVFVDYFGVSPHKYLLLRRLHKIRDTLQHSDAAETTVTQIAAQFGFWQFGRFAGQYRRLFGELPSTTLAGNKSQRGRPSAQSLI